MDLKVLILFITLTSCSAGIQDYFRGISTYFGYRNEENDDSHLEGFDQKIPYEVSVIDEKFIEEAAKLTGISLSELDKCQQRIVLRLRKGCQEMNDEDVSKMAVMLLNCQSAVEGRRLYPCYENMSIKDCTSSMDADTWNTYHLMSNRVRAVCYSARQSQFIGITEHTITKLLDAARNQVFTLDKMVNQQESLRNIAVDTLENVSQGNRELKQQQEDIAKSQFRGQLVIEDNIRRLVEEKKLISESHSHLADMTKNVQTKLEEAAKQLEEQAEITNVNHRELLQDLIEIQKKTQEIFDRIDESSRLLILQSQEAQKQYDSTIKQLADMNTTVHSLVSIIHATREVMEEKLSWISVSLGGTDVVVDRLYLLLWHISLIILGMIICAFLSCNILTRVLITVIPITNLTFALYEISIALSPLDLFISLFTTLIVTNLMYMGTKFYVNTSTIMSKSIPKLQEEETKKTPSPFRNGIKHSFSDKDVSANSSHISKSCGDLFERNIAENEDTFSDIYSPTPPLSRVGHYNSRSRSRTPLHINSSSLKSPCRAKTRIGTTCKLMSLPGRDFCHRHQGGDSLML